MGGGRHRILTERRDQVNRQSLKIAGPPNPRCGITGSPNQPHLSAFPDQSPLHGNCNCMLWNPKLRGRSEDH
eukprot:scaffold17303_cov154-Skeletonema_marinoi.AAC.4